MIYPNLTFPKRENRPFFYSNFVSTVDGKVTVKKDPQSYWPIGSTNDYDLLVELRACGDLLIHGKNTATAFYTLKSLAKVDFKNLRKKLGKSELLPYLVVSNHPDPNLALFLGTKDRIPVMLATTNQAKTDFFIPENVEVLRLGETDVDLNALSLVLKRKGFTNCLIEGGPTLMMGFLKDNLLDEIFLTLAPKIFGGEPGVTPTMVEGYLFPPDQVKNLKLLIVKQIGNELFLRYQLANDYQANKN